MAAEAKDAGTKAFKNEDFATALIHFEKCVELEPSDHIHWSNRSAVRTKLMDYEGALADAKKCVELKEDFAKGWARIGVAGVYLRRFDEAEAAFKKGLSLEPENQGCKNGLKTIGDERAKPAVRKKRGILASAINPLGLSTKHWVIYFSVVVCVVAVIVRKRFEAALNKASTPPHAAA
jgi:tetratricopeptide (TPR) repeat protein